MDDVQSARVAGSGASEGGFLTVATEGALPPEQHHRPADGRPLAGTLCRSVLHGSMLPTFVIAPLVPLDDCPPRRRPPDAVLKVAAGTTWLQVELR